MTAELFIHGPRHAFYGKRDEVAYSQLFDDSQIKDNVRFIVEIRKGSDGKWYTYYNYCRYANVLDIAGRNGAYLGITLRLDVYYANLRNVYTILHSVFVKGVVGLLLKNIPNGYQYIVNDFEDSKNSILEKIEKPLGTLLSNIISLSEVCTIDGSFKVGGQPVFKGIDDTLFMDRRLNDIKNSGKIIFSSSLPIEQIQTIIDNCEKDKQSFAESKMQYIEQLQQNLNNANSKLNETILELKNSKQITKILEEKVDTLNSEIISFAEERKNIKNLKVANENLSKKNKSLEQEIDSLNKTILKLNESIQCTDKLKNDIRNLQKEKELLHDNISKLTKQLNKANDNFNKAEKEIKWINTKSTQKEIKEEMVQEEVHQDTTKLVKYLKLVGAFFCGAIAFFIIGYFVGNKTNNTDKEKESKVELKQEIVSFSLPEQKVESYPNNLSDRIYPSLSIEDILILSDDSIFTGSEYEVILKEHNLDSCKWRVTNADVIEEEAFKLRFRPAEIGVTEISVLYNDTIIVKRSIQIY